MKKIRSAFTFILYKYIFPFSAFFSFFMILLLSFGGSRILRDKALILLFAAAAIALANLVFYIPKFGVYFKIATHFVLTGLILLAVLWMSDYMKTGNWVLLLVGYLIAYAFICPIVLIVRSRFRKKKEEEKNEDYSSRFN